MLKQNSAGLWLSRTDAGHPWSTPTSLHTVTNAWRLFIKELVKKLVVPYMKRYLEGTGPTLKSILQRQWEDVGWKTKHHWATGIHQTEWSIEEEEVQDLPSCQRQISQRQTSELVFSVWPVCKEHKPVVVICEACKHWDGNLIQHCTCVV